MRNNPEVSSPSIYELTREPDGDHGQRLAALPRKAYEEIKGLVLSNRLQGGEYIMEERLAKAVGMSRTPLREALVQLQNEGLIAIVPRRGIRVVPITVADIREIYSILGSLEANAAIALAKRPDREKLVNELLKFVSGMRKALIANDIHAWDRANEQLHEQLIASSGNKRLAKVCENLLDQSQRVRSFTLHLRRPPTLATDAQAAMLRAIKDGDGELAAAIQIRHKRDWLEELEGLLARLQLQFL